MSLPFYLYPICYLILPQKGKLSHSASIHRVANQHRLFDGEIVERVPKGLSLQHSIYMNLTGKNCVMKNKSWVITELFEISNIRKIFLYIELTFERFLTGTTYRIFSKT